MAVEPEIIEHYESNYDEASRLFEGAGRLERLRTQAVIERHLTAPAQRILDIGGGTGVYASWLVGLGHEVRLIDPVPRHVAAARAAGVEAEQGATGALDHLRDGQADLVLLLGPLYHLVDPHDRAIALAEARRLLRPGGHLIAAGISRFASMQDGLSRRILRDRRFDEIVLNGLATGEHRNPTNIEGRFTTAFFHHPDQLRDEVASAGFADVTLIGVEGIVGWLTEIDDRLDDPAERDVTLAMLARVESEPTLLGVSSHLLAIGAVPRRDDQ